MELLERIYLSPEHAAWVAEHVFHLNIINNWDIPQYYIHVPSGEIRY